MESWAKGTIEVAGWQFIPARLTAVGLTAEDGMTQVWFVDENQQVTGGAEATNMMLRYIWWARPLAYLYYIPGIRQLQDRLYRWVANNRYMMPGSTDACAIPAEKRPPPK